MVAGFATWVNLSESAYFLRMPQPEEDEVVVPVAIAPDLIKIMDLQQEQLARSLRGGHRVIHGVAGSGKRRLSSFTAETKHICDRILNIK
ncbi:MAG: hypothetical protein ACK6CP_08060 [Pseudanabaena sp.]|jgi:hypothetical protein